MNRLQAGLAVVVLAILAGCAANRNAIKNDVVYRTDPKSITDYDRFHADADECVGYAVEAAQRVKNEQMIRAAVGLVLGAAIGYGISRGYDVDSRNTTMNTAVGAAGGMAGGATSVRNPIDELIWNCMVGRGYRMLY